MFSRLILNFRLMKLISFIRLKLPLQQSLKRLESSHKCTFICCLSWNANGVLDAIREMTADKERYRFTFSVSAFLEY